MCGVFGVRSDEREVARLTYFGLFALQHRGQESAGIAVSERGRVTAVRDMGLVRRYSTKRSSPRCPGEVAIGHTRYSTTGGARWSNAQPLVVHGAARTVALGHNGNLVHLGELRDELLADGVALASSSDTEVIGALLARDDAPIPDAVARTMQRLAGAYSVVAITDGALVAFRDPLGIRPLSLGKIGDDWVVASETCALDLVGAEVVRDVEPGEVVWIDEDGLPLGAGRAAGWQRLVHLRARLLRPPRLRPRRHRRPRGARANGRAPRRGGARRRRSRDADPRLGHARRDRVREAVGPSVRGGADQEPLRRQDVHRARPGAAPAGDQAEVQPACGDRGTAPRDRRRLHRPRQHDARAGRDAPTAGAAEVHVRISSPPVVSPCFYGIDMADEDELAAAHRSVEEMREHVAATSLAYLSLDGMQWATRLPEEAVCRACFTRRYPTAVPAGRRREAPLRSDARLTPRSEQDRRPRAV